MVDKIDETYGKNKERKKTSIRNERGDIPTDPADIKNDWAIDTHNNLDDPQRHCAEWKKLVSKAYILLIPFI